MAEITRINAELLSMKDEAAALMRENRDYHDRIARLEDDLKLARRRELTVVDELTKAIKSSNFDSSSLPMTPSTKRFRKSPGRY
jgi:predicted  nucleic acid-binding Zn-ribbon protein